MNSLSRSFVIAITALSVAAILLIAFAWAGPGLQQIASPTAASVLFDEGLVRDIYQRVSPAVVEVSVDLRSGDAFVQVSAASGFLIDEEGHVATNDHVIQGADRVRIAVADGRAAEAVVLGRNPANDLALLKVNRETVEGIKPVALGDSSMAQPGQLAIAIGSPLGLEGSVTVGIISGVGRTLPSDLGRAITGVLQTDALIGPGNSGGPLLNSSGQAIGINAAIQRLQSGSNPRSIGFAVPSNTLVELLPRLKANQVVHPPWLGTRSATLEPLLVERLKLPVDCGIYVIEVFPGSPAAQAGLVPSGADPQGRPATGGDIIVAVAGVPIRAGADLTSEFNHHQPGDQVTVTVLRGGSQVDVPVILGHWPAEPASRPLRVFSTPQPQNPEAPRHPHLPSIPGFPIPDLFPENRHR